MILVMCFNMPTKVCILVIDDKKIVVFLGNGIFYWFRIKKITRHFGTFSTKSDHSGSAHAQ